MDHEAAMARGRQRFIERRKIVGLSQEKLAETVGVERTTVKRWERGESSPQPGQRPRLAVALGITVEQLHELLLDTVDVSGAHPGQSGGAERGGSGMVAVSLESPVPPGPAPEPALTWPGATDLHLPDDQLVRLLQQLDGYAAVGDGLWAPRDREAVYTRLIAFLSRWASTVRRREVLRMLGWAAAAASAGPSLHVLDPDEQERVALAIQTPSRVDDRVIDHIEAVLWRCKRQDDALGPQVTLDTVLAQRSLVETVLPVCPDALRPRLLSVSSNLSGEAGWLMFDLNDFEAAGYYYEQARTRAHAAQDMELAALALSYLSRLATWRDQPRVGIDHAIAAQGWAAKSGNQVLCAHAADRAARAYAKDQQPAACRHELDTAEAFLASAPPGPPDALMYFYTDGVLSATKSTCLVSLGDAKEAVSHAEQSLALSDDSFVRDRASAMLYLANAYLLDGEIDGAARAIAEAADLALHNRSARLVTGIRDARWQLRPWSDNPSIRDLDEQLSTYGLTA